MADVIAIVMWQMFLPLQYIATIVLAGVIAKWQMEQPHVTVCFYCFLGRWNGHYFVFICDGRCYCPVADGMATAGCECFHPGRCCSQGTDEYG